MPSGYTADLYEGKTISFQEFAMRCARAFGALAMMRDEPWDAKIPETIKPDDYHKKELKKAEARVEEVESWSNTKAEEKAAECYQKELDAYKKAVAKTQALKQRYEAMLEKVNSWVPPTLDHTDFRKFMINQLQDSIQHDCHKMAPPKRLTGTEYKNELIQELKRSIKYHTEQHKEAVEAAKNCSEWLRVLRNSLKG